MPTPAAAAAAAAAVRSEVRVHRPPLRLHHQQFRHAQQRLRLGRAPDVVVQQLNLKRTF
jgi:hypothetical protein